MNNFENETNEFEIEIEFYDVESNGVLSPEEIDGELANGEFEFPNYDDLNEDDIATRASSSPVTLGVNRSDYNINVRSGAGTSNSKVATMRVGESFCFTGLRSYNSDGYEWHQIEILYPDGSWNEGWYRGMNGVGYWRNNPYRKVGDKQYYRLSQATSLYTPGGDFMMKLEAGRQVYCNSQDRSGITGSKNHDYMLCHGVSFSDGDMSIYQLSSWQDYDQVSYAYIDTQMKHGDSHVKGNW